jgi:hypothetical protein
MMIITGEMVWHKYIRKLTLAQVYSTCITKIASNQLSSPLLLYQLSLVCPTCSTYIAAAFRVASHENVSIVNRIGTGYLFSYQSIYYLGISIMFFTLPMK